MTHTYNYLQIYFFLYATGQLSLAFRPRTFALSLVQTLCIC